MVLRRALILAMVIASTLACLATPLVIIVGGSTSGIGEAKVYEYVSVSGSSLGTERLAPPVKDNPNSPAQQVWVSLANGDNSVAVPSIAAGVIIIPPSTNTVGEALKGAHGDVGVSLSPKGPSDVCFPNPPPSSIDVYANDAVTGEEFIFY